MRKKIFAFMQAALLSLTQAYADVAVKVPDVNIMPGTKAYIYINVDLGKDAYTAYQFDIAYPDGISSVKSEGKDEPSFVKGNMYSDTQGVSSVYTDTGLDRYQCFSINSDPFTAQSGTLLALPVLASKTLAKGTYQATISPIEFVKTDATPDRPDVITFNIVVGDQLVLNEESIAPPLPASGVNVFVKRTIPANEWNAIVLPFSMDEAQTKDAFGSDVQLADFNGIESTYADEAQEKVTDINVMLSSATTITANRPCLIKVSKDISEFAINGVDVSPEENPSVDMNQIGQGTIKNPYLYNSLIGTYMADFSLAKLVAEGNFPLILSGGKFSYANAATQPLKAFHAYFDFYDVLSELGNAAACIKMVFDDTPTGINTVQTMGANDAYNLQGMKVNSDYKGIVIKRGRKIVNK